MSLLAAMLVVPPLLCALTLAVLIGFLPVPFADTIARTLQRVIAAIIGDSYALLGNAITAGTVVSQVRRDLAWLASRCERVIVVAHSQGAAIAQMAIREDPLTECELLITYGSGLHKLTLVETMARQQGTALIWIGVGLLLVADSMLAWALTTGSGTNLSYVSVAVLTVAALVSLAGYLRHAGDFSPARQLALDRQLFEERFQLRNERVSWTDVFASDDPVPNGPLLDEYAPPQGLITHQTYNIGSPIWDHTSYWDNRDDFVSKLARLLLSRANVDVDLDKDYRLRENVARTRRQWRVSWRRSSGWVAATAVGCLAFRLWTRPFDAAVGAYTAAEPVIRQTPLVGEWLAPTGALPFHSPAGVMFFALLFLIVSWGLVGRWNAWNRSEMKAFFRRQVFTSLAPPPVIYWVSLTVVLLLGVVTVLEGLPLVVAAGLLALASAVWLANASFGTWFWEGVLARAASGPILEVRDRWHRLEERALKRHVEHGRRRAVFEMGLQGIKAATPVERDLGRRALERALAMGLRDAAWWLGRHLEEEKDWANARSAYEEGKRLGDAHAAYNLGILQRDHFGDAPAAIAAFEDAARTMPESFPSAAHSLGLMHRHAQRHRLARRAFRRGVELSDPLSIEWLGDEYRDAFVARRDRAPLSAAIVRGAAVACYQQAVERGSHSAARELGSLLLEDKDVAGAIAAFEAGVRLRDDRCAEALGEVLLLEGRRDEAEHAFRLAIELWQRPDDEGRRNELTPAATRSAWQLGQRLEERGAIEPAMRLYRFAAGCAAAPSSVSAPNLDRFCVVESALHLGRMLHERGDDDSALQAWHRAIALGSIEARVLVAEVLLSRGRHADGLAQLRAALTALGEDYMLDDRDRARLCLTIGNACARQHEPDDAVAAYRLALERGQGSTGGAVADSGTRLVTLICRQRRMDDARSLTAEAWRIRRHSDRMTLARFLILNGEAALAVPLLDAGVTADDALSAGRLLEDAGESERAIEAYERAMDRGSRDGTERVLTLLRNAGDSARLERAERAARLLGVATTSQPSVT
jgi:tetratricopeptide (TPR) repeat protein